MGQDQATSQAKMDDLLASLRKGLGSGADSEEIQSKPTSRSGPEEPASSDLVPTLGRFSPSDEISVLRKRIAGKIGRDLQPNGFAAILSGKPLVNPPPVPFLLEDRDPGGIIPDSPPVLRQSVNDGENADFEQFSVQAPQPETAQLQARIRPAAHAPGLLPTDRVERSKARERGLMSEISSAAANTSFNRLTETLMTRTLAEQSTENLTREILRTMLKQWLNDNLPSLVERIVRDEIERVARRGTKR